ncbi:protein kinase [Leishmania donovani]|uniref:Protein_kinase_putative/GeneDB:LmjF.08.0660 n=2 Tax=Leishmania donovani TaxID=5661 RepID=A0A6J8F3Z9_LEIDO|nr:protein kinase [Leishmania donovani]VDZ42332.1 protein_kinase_putative/GeneDB:LmjF.08.0660 [Leishmania donovani]
MPRHSRHSMGLTLLATPRATPPMKAAAGVSPMKTPAAHEQGVPMHPPEGRHQPLSSRCSSSPAWLRKVKHVGTAARNVLCRLDICWAVFYFVFLVCVGSVSSSISYRLVSRSLIEAGRSLHENRITTVNKLIDQSMDRVDDMAGGLLTLYMKTQFLMQSEKTLSVLCALLERYDEARNYRAFSVISLEQLEMISCWRGSAEADAGGPLIGAISLNHTVNATYYVNRSNYMLNRPLQVSAVIPEGNGTVAALVSNYAASELIEYTQAYYKGSIDSVDIRLRWLQPSSHPHLIYYNYPAGLIYRSLKLPTNVSITDCTQVHIDGARLALNTIGEAKSGFLLAVFINQSLADADPLIMSNNWGQQTVHDNIIFPFSEHAPTAYLKSSNVSHPLMREALKHVDLSRMRDPGYKHSVDFRYNDARAVITVWAYTSCHGLTLPLVYVNSQNTVTGPYLRLHDTLNGVLAAVMVLVSLVFWLFVQLYFAAPLREITRLLNCSVQRGARALYRAGKHGIGALAEVRALGNAHNAAMRQLREVDAFVPAAVRKELPRGTLPAPLTVPIETTLAGLNVVMGSSENRAAHLARHLSTVVYITVRPPQPPPVASHSSSRTPAPLSTQPAGHDAAAITPRCKQRLSVMVQRAVHAVNATSSGPFATPAALEAFASVVHELAHTHRGTVLRLRPDTCILHFHAAVRAHLLPRQEVQLVNAADVDVGTEELAQQDARDAAAFALALLSWVDEQQTAEGQLELPRMPDVRALLDTSLFTCGQYRPADSEQTMTVALGRDVLRDAGSMVERIGVRVAMTEETAARVLRGGSGDSGAAAVSAIPVEALCTGRAEHDADELVLYEALCSRVASGTALQLYARCCFDGFARMRQGDYAGALTAFCGVAAIADLDPGLLPPCLRREVAASGATVGAVSVQVARLMRECERCVRAGVADGFQRVPRRPPGMDAVLPDDITPLGTAPPVSTARSGVPAASAKPRRMASSFTAPPWYPEVGDRHVMLLSNGAVTTRVVVPTPPAWVRDNHGMYWQLACRKSDCTPPELWACRILALGSAGAIASVNYIMYREVHPVVAKAIRDAPPGPISDALRRATPVCGPTAQQDAAIKRLITRHQELRHPNILAPLAYSQSVEGGVVLIWEFCPGGTLRQLLARYPRVKSVTFACFGLQMLSALSHLHERGVAHGRLNLDNVMVDSNGHCRLIGQFADHALEREIFHFKPSCYLSPAMAAGALPTPPCDMFCYGLLAMEAVTQQPCWRWATAAEYGGHRDSKPPSAKELADLMATGGQRFADAVVQGRVVLNLEQLDVGPITEHHNDTMISVCRRLLSLDPASRPTAAELREENKFVLNLLGITMEEDTR